ncbi:hypothetical protein EWF20_06320 [Sulfolobus sp. S-194]|uniref:hypothetical protein n=1 Tax=Sulfolobus sp. S-194 TaxID=2512240 RepID=UPI0014373BBE|nr:hypothetical protein [Sulfolobus sp. S-194]QIW23807.1 hypothetical protein EWF20_06320 [Sulfolobus sp. S-194]
MLKDFEEIVCTKEEYYDTFGRFHEVPYYVPAKCYMKEYEWGTATILEDDLDTDFGNSLAVYLDIVNFPPPIVEHIIEEDEGYDAIVEATMNYSKASIFFYSATIPVDYNLELECDKDKLVECIDNVSSWINDYIKYLVKVAEDFLRKNKPEELSEVKCEKCGVTLRKYEYPYHLETHKIEEAKRQLKEIEERIYEGIDEKEYPLAFKYFRSEIDKLITTKLLPVFKDLAEKINQKISEMGIIHLNSNQLYVLNDIQEEIIKNVPKIIRDKFILEMTIIPAVLSNSALDKFINMTVNDQIIERKAYNFSVNVKRKRDRFYVHMYLNDDHIAYFRVDAKTKDKIRSKIAEYIIDEKKVEEITQELYNKVREKIGIK